MNVSKCFVKKLFYRIAKLRGQLKAILFWPDNQ